MSWVSDIVLLANLAERFTESFEMLDEPVAIAGINRWLEQGNWAPLVSLSDQLTTEKAFQACVYGGALNKLDVPEFLKAAAAQPWREKAGVMLLVKNEEEVSFTPYRLSSEGSFEKVL